MSHTRPVQLSQVEHALEVDPQNAELSSLRDELANLISLTKEYHASQEATKPKTHTYTKESTHQYHAGDECMARHQADGRWYPARITSVAGSAENPVYSILYTKHRTTDVVTASDLRPRQQHANAQAGMAGEASGLTTTATMAMASTKPKNTGALRPMTNDERERERERKRARKEKKLEREAAKNMEHDRKQSSWQKFQAKAVKKKYGVAGDRSMFKTPDDPYAKSTYNWFCTITHTLFFPCVERMAVGSSGGRGMTKQAPRLKNTYETPDE